MLDSAFCLVHCISGFAWSVGRFSVFIACRCVLYLGLRLSCSLVVFCWQPLLYIVSHLIQSLFGDENFVLRGLLLMNSDCCLEIEEIQAHHL